MLGLVFLSRRSGLPLKRTVIAHMIDGRSLVGVLVGVYADSYVLAHARLLPDLEAVLGEPIIPRDKVTWFQADPPDHLLNPPTS